MGMLKQEYWNELPFPIPGDLSYPGIKPKSPALAGGFFTTERPWKPQIQKELLIKYKTIQKQNP